VGRRIPSIAGLVAVVALAAAGCGGGSSGGSASSGGTQTNSNAGRSSVILTGAGSTFAQPLYQQWAGQYAQDVDPNVHVNYQGIGSGGGIADYTQGTVDFGATDAPMSDEELQAAQANQGTTLHIPTVLGAVAVAYNLQGVDGLKLDGPTLAGIFQGSITKWNDPAIAKLNSGASLPDTQIQVVHRSDSSGTSFIFTSYLTAVSSEWKSKVGADKAPPWPTGTGAEGTSGVAAAVQQSDGAIGYVELGYAEQNTIPFASLKEASGGQFVKPSADSTTAAADGVEYPEDLRFSLINSKTEGNAYPIVSATWIVAAQKQTDRDKGRSLVQWLQWGLTDGQDGVDKIGYAPLPKTLASASLKAVSSITVPKA
jgi:phosphate transport system substrate-binding protein